MPPKQKKEFCFLTLYATFIRDSKSGKRMQPNGKRFSEGTIENYVCTQKLLAQFSEKKAFPLRIIPERWLTKREADVERNYWKKFYRRFTDYLYDDLGYFDNYVGSTIKNIKTFFNYLNRDLAVGVGFIISSFMCARRRLPYFPYCRKS